MFYSLEYRDSTSGYGISLNMKKKAIFREIKCGQYLPITLHNPGTGDVSTDKFNKFLPIILKKRDQPANPISNIPPCPASRICKVCNLGNILNY